MGQGRDSGTLTDLCHFRYLRHVVPHIQREADRALRGRLRRFSLLLVVVVIVVTTGP